MHTYTFTCSYTNAHMQQYLQSVANGLPTMMEEKDTHAHTHTHHTIYDNN